MKGNKRRWRESTNPFDYHGFYRYMWRRAYASQDQNAAPPVIGVIGRFLFDFLCFALVVYSLWSYFFQ